MTLLISLSINHMMILVILVQLFSLHLLNLSISNVLYVPTMQRNIISISQFCIKNDILIEFLPDSFHVKDQLTGGTHS